MPNDIAIILLEKPVKNVKPVALATTTPKPESSAYWVVGLGLLSQKPDKLPTILQMVRRLRVARCMDWGGRERAATMWADQRWSRGRSMTARALKNFEFTQCRHDVTHFEQGKTWISDCAKKPGFPSGSLICIGEPRLNMLAASWQCGTCTAGTFCTDTTEQPSS